MAKEELDRASISANETAVNVKQQDVALLLKKKNAVDQQAETTEAEAHVEQAAVETQEEAVMVASADSVFASDGAYMVAQAGGSTSSGNTGLSTGTLLAIGGVALVGGGIAIAASDDDDNNDPAPVPTAIAGPASVNEGATALFTVTGEPNTTLTYVISGVQAEDVTGGALTGQVQLDANGNGVIAVQLVEDDLTEGAQTLTVSVDGVSAAVTVNDTSINIPQDLTQQVDNYTVANGNATEGDDSYNGVLAAGGIGFLGDTLNPGDSIDAGGGRDSLTVLVAGASQSIANVTTFNLEDLTLNFNTPAGNSATTLDGVGFNGLSDITLNVLAPNATGSLTITNLSGALENLTVNGGDRIAGTSITAPSVHSGSFFVSVTAGSEPLTIDNISISDIFGSASLTVTQLSNIPTITLTNVGIDSSGDMTLNVLDSVGTGGNDTLTVTIDNVADAFNGNSYEIGVVNQSGNGVIENIALTVAGGTNNLIDFNSTTVLDSVTVGGPGDAFITFSSSSAVTSFDASAAAGDIGTSISNTGTLTATFGSGNDYLSLSSSGDATVSMGDGNDWTDLFGSGDTTLTSGLGNDLVRMFANNTDDVDLGDGDDVLLTATGTFFTEDVAVGGAGFDTLGMDAADFNALTTASGFEGVLAQGGTGTYDLSVLPGVTTLAVGGIDTFGFGPAFFNAPGTTSVFTQVSTVGSFYGFSNAAASVTTLAINFNNSNSISVDRAVDNTSNSLTVQLGNNADDSTTAYDALTVNSLTVQDEESLTINSFGYTDAGDGVADLNTVSNLNSSDLSELTVTGDKDLELTSILGVTNLTRIDASAFTGDLSVLTAAGNAAGGVQFIGGSGDDTYFGTAFGDAINAGLGQDTVTLGVGGVEDTLIFEAGDSLVGVGGGEFDVYNGFISTEDTIDLGAFGFTGAAASAIFAVGDQNATFVAADEDTVIADFFNQAGQDRAVAFSSNGVDTYVLVDANADGNFNGDTDLVILLMGTATVDHSDFGF